MAHIHELIDFVVNAYIVNNDRVLLIFHKKLQRWLCIGGHIELDEDPEEALLREIKEECGLEVEILAQKPEGNFRENKFLYTPNYIDSHKLNPDGKHRHIALTYFCRALSDKFTLAKDEHEDIRWFREDELDDPKYDVLDSVKFLSKAALKALSKN